MNTTKTVYSGQSYISIEVKDHEGAPEGFRSCQNPYNYIMDVECGRWYEFSFPVYIGKNIPAYSRIKLLDDGDCYTQAAWAVKAPMVAEHANKTGRMAMQILEGTDDGCYHILVSTPEGEISTKKHTEEPRYVGYGDEHDANACMQAAYDAGLPFGAEYDVQCWDGSWDTRKQHLG